MKKEVRLMIGLLVLISGVAFIPVMGLPLYGFQWQRYADVYTPSSLEINHELAQPGSFLTVVGYNFEPDASAVVSINGTVVGSVLSDSTGGLMFVLDTTGAATGFYNVDVLAGSQSFTQFWLVDDADLWAKEDDATVLPVPADIAVQVLFLPAVRR